MGSEDEDSESDEDAVGRAEELRRERLTALVKRNLTAILLDVTNRMFGALSFSQGPACMHARIMWGLHMVHDMRSCV